MGNRAGPPKKGAKCFEENYKKSCILFFEDL
jgi:hypothetical protein